MVEQRNKITDEAMQMKILQNEFDHIKRSLDEIKKSLVDRENKYDETYLRKEEFKMVRNIVYVGASTILLAVLNELLNIIQL